MIKAFYLRLAKPAGSRANQTPKILLKIFVSVAILVLLFAWLSTDELLSAIVSVPLQVWVLVIGLFTVGHIISALKWRLMMQASGITVHFLLSIRAHFAGLFANLYLPSIVGGDVIRAALVMREQSGDSAAIALGSLADRLNDVVALLIIAGIAAFLMGPGQYDIPANFLAGFVILIFGGALTCVVIVRLLPARMLPTFLQGTLDKLGRALNSLSKAPLAALAGLLISLFIQGSFVGLNVIIASAMGINTDILVWMFAWPMAKLVALAPISFGGIGVREVALAGALAPFGVATHLAVAQSLSWEIVLLFTGLVSGFTVAILPGNKAESE